MVLLWSAVLRAHSATSLWSNVTDNWSVGGDWSPASVPISGTSTVLDFGGSGAATYTTTNDLAPAPFLLGGLQLNSTSSVAQKIAGNALRFGGLGAQISQNRSGAFTIDAALDVAKPMTFAGTGLGSVVLNGALSGAGLITRSGPSPYRLGSPAPGTPSGNTFHGGFTLIGGDLRFSNDGDTGRTALRANRITLNGSSTLGCNSELSSGELSGNSGAVLARDATTGNGQNILLLMLDDATFAGSLGNSATAPGTNAGAVVIRGTSTQTFSGPLAVNGDVVAGRGATLIFSGNTSLATSTAAAVVLQGGSFVLDNATLNITNRLRDSGATGIEVGGGGEFQLIGHTAGTTETVARLQLGSATQTRAGALKVGVVHRAGVTAATVLNIANYSRDSASAPRTTVDFTATNTAGATLTLGQSGNVPRIVFGLPFLFNNLLSRSNVSADSSVGWATVHGAGFATHGANGIGAAATASFPASSSPTGNALLAGSGTIASALTFSLNSLVLAPSAPGQSLAITSTGSLSTNGLLLRGNTDYAITNTGGGTGGLTGPGGARYIHVQSAALTIEASLAVGVSTATNAVTKAGEGTLILTHPANSTLLRPFTINAGTIRATPGTSLPGGRVELRGGVIELIGGGTYNPTLGIANGNLNWRGDDTGTPIVTGLSKEDKGSGGFAAVGAHASVDFNGAGVSTLTWEQPYFIDPSHALILGSARADRRITFIDNLNLTSPSVLPNYRAREICVIDNPDSTSDFARLSGAISGGLYSDLLKTGNGILELTGNNTFTGGLILAEGALLTNNGAGLGAAEGAYVLLGGRSGNASTGVFASNSTGSITIPRAIDVLSGSGGAAIVGNSIAPDAITAGNAVFSGNLLLGTSGDNRHRLLQLRAESGTTVDFSGAIANNGGYGGIMSLEKIGTGMMIFSGANTYSGPLAITAGTLQAGAVNTLPAGSVIGFLPGTTLDLNDFDQTIAALTGGGAVQLGSASLTLGSGNLSGTITGTGAIIKTGTGTLTFPTGATFSGPTTLEGGTFTGTGTLAGALTIQQGATFAPGSFVGKMTTGAATYAPGGAYQWQINHANDTQGGPSGSDWHNINGPLTITATSSERFVIDITGLTAANVPGVVPTFNNAANNSWIIATASGGIVGFDRSKFLLQTTNFANNNDLFVGGFILTVSGNNLVLNFSSTPPTFEVWQSTKFSAAELLNDAISGINADAERDGWTNLLEYAFDGDPHRSSTALAPFVAIEGGYPTLTYSRRKNAYDLTYTVEVSTALMVWDPSPGATVETSVVDQGAFDRVTIRTTHLLSAVPEQFLRVKTTWTP